ncbi:MAG TPA: [protein-PII] uridylyltransferase, partial [Byssovorax sp.]
MNDPEGPATEPLSSWVRGRLAARRAEIVQAMPPDGAAPAPFGLAAGRAYASALDDIVREIAARADVTGVEIAAVGGLGRGAVALGSDLDVRVVSQDEDAARRVADALLYPLWDAGVPVGHQVVAPDALLDAARDDLPSATSLLDYRHLAGDASIGEALVRRAEAGIFAHSELPAFLARLEAEAAQRHARFGGSVYLLEPDVKNGAGGLRDLDIVRWAAQSRFRVGEPDDLVRKGALVPREAAEIHAATEFLWQARTLLHAHARRRSDRLTFDEQEAIARELGHGDGGEAIERFMSAYYRTARTVERALARALARAAPTLTRRRPREEELPGGVRLFDGAVTLGDPALLKSDPAIALRVVEQAALRGASILPFARDAIATACESPQFCADLRASDEAARRFVALASTCKETSLRAGSVMRELHEIGLVLAMIPEFSPVVGRVHHDTYHVYTVDVHSVAAVDRLATLVRGELAAEFPLACRLAAEIARPPMLFFATLLHDVGKAIGGSDHSVRGAEMARGILERLGFDAGDVDAACHLIAKHLVMYHVATRRDLDDPAAIAEFTREVDGHEGLRDLYLLTVADLSTTSPTSMTSWKARMLDELYLAADRALDAAGGDERAGEARAATLRARAVAEVGRAAEAAPGAGSGEARRAEIERFLASMPDRYLRANAPAAIVAHAELARFHEAQCAGAGPSSPTIALVPSRHPEAAEICVVADDRPGLLAAITAALAASRLEVHAAQIHSRVTARGVEALDLFWVRDRAEGVDGVARALPKLARDVHALLAGEASAHDVARRRGTTAARERTSPPIAPQVSIDPRASTRHTVIEVIARDRPGLLFAISDALHRLGLSISVAKINTEGARVADVFYVSEADG